MRMGFNMRIIRFPAPFYGRGCVVIGTPIAILMLNLKYYYILHNIKNGPGSQKEDHRLFYKRTQTLMNNYLS